MKHRHYIFIVFLCLAKVSLTQVKLKPQDYISKYYLLAIEEMNKYKIPASIKLAQGLIEAESGNSLLATKANNHFGIKCKSEWTGPTFIKDDDTKNECFRAYGSAEESYRDHSIFLLKPRYSQLFNLDISDYRSWAFGLKQAGYATNPNYPAMLIKYIEDYKLHQFDKFGKDREATDEPKTSQKPKVKFTKEELIKRRKDLANNLDLVIVDEDFDIYSLAAKTKLSIQSLLEINDAEGEQAFRYGQNFFLQRKLKENSKDKHIVQAGESLYDISQMYGVSLKLIRKYNKLESWEQPHVGEIINLSKVRDDFIKSRTFYTIEKERHLKNLELYVPIDTQENIGKNVESLNLVASNELKKKDTYTKPLVVEVVDTNRKWINHIVKVDETIFRISKLYGCKLQELIDWNGIVIEDGVKPGQILRLYTANPNGIIADTTAKVNTPIDSTPILSNTSLSKAMDEAEKLVNMPLQNKLKSETILDSSAWIFHTVKPKETLYSITKAYSCTSNDLSKWNEIASGQPLRIGQVLKIKSKSTQAKLIIHEQKEDSPKSISKDTTSLTSKSLKATKNPKLSIVKSSDSLPRKDSIIVKSRIKLEESSDKMNINEFLKFIKSDTTKKNDKPVKNKLKVTFE